MPIVITNHTTRCQPVKNDLSECDIVSSLWFVSRVLKKHGEISNKDMRSCMKHILQRMYIERNLYKHGIHL